MKIVTIEIDEKGDVNVDLAGFQGKGCAAVQEGFTRALGKAESVTKKPEYNKPQQNVNRLGQG